MTTTAACGHRWTRWWTGAGWGNRRRSPLLSLDAGPMASASGLLLACEAVTLQCARYTEGMTREVATHSAEETIAFGRTLVELLAPPKLVLLRGDLGAGKTTLVKGIAAGFEAAEEEDVTSPTFTLVHEYSGPRANLYHIDLYRVDTQRELETLGLDDLRSDGGVLLIEWGEKFPRLLRERDVEISFERQNEMGQSEMERKIQIRSQP